jgi:hypothetical protein
MLQPAKQSVAQGGLDWVIGPLDAHKQTPADRFVNTGQISLKKIRVKLGLAFVLSEKLITDLSISK